MRPATVVMRDPHLPHQPVTSYQWGPRGTWIAISCNCRRVPGTGGVYPPIEARERWEPAALLAAYHTYHGSTP